MMNWKRVFDWRFDSKPRDALETASIFNQAFNVPGFKELLANDVYFYKRKVVESKGEDAQSLYLAEAYARLLDKMVQSRKLILEHKAKAEQAQALQRDGNV